MYKYFYYYYYYYYSVPQCRPSQWDVNAGQVVQCTTVRVSREECRHTESVFCVSNPFVGVFFYYCELQE